MNLIRAGAVPALYTQADIRTPHAAADHADIPGSLMMTAKNVSSGILPHFIKLSNWKVK